MSYTFICIVGFSNTCIIVDASIMPYSCNVPVDVDIKPFSSVPATIKHREAKSETETTNSDATKGEQISQRATRAAHVDIERISW